MPRTLIAVVTALAVVALAPLAAAAASADACYADGYLSISGSAGAAFRVLGEMPDGSYTVVARGSLNQMGSISLPLAARGPCDNGLPQFRVHVLSDEESTWIAIPDEEAGWGWD